MFFDRKAKKTHENLQTSALNTHLKKQKEIFKTYEKIEKRLLGSFLQTLINHKIK